jgi:hypothetical protein
MNLRQRSLAGSDVIDNARAHGRKACRGSSGFAHHSLQKQESGAFALHDLQTLDPGFRRDDGQAAG